MSPMPRLLLVSALLCLPCAPLAAQSKVYLPSNSPNSGKMNLAPLGGKARSGSSQNMRTQVLVPKTLMPAGGSKIQQLAFASSSVGSYKYRSFVIKMGHLKGTSFSTSFAANISASVTVYSSKAFAFKKADSWSVIKLDKPFDHDGKRDLIVDIVIQGASYSGQNGSSIAGSRRGDGAKGLKRVYALSYDIAKPAKTGFGPYPGGPKMFLDVVSSKTIEFYGIGCKDSLGRVPSIQINKTPKPGGNLSFSGGSSAAGQGTFLLFGLDNKKFGAVSLPLKLDSLGAPSCWLHVNILFVIPGDKKSGSFATPAWPLPKSPSLVGIDLYGQWLVVDPKANKLGFVFSQGLRARIIPGP